MVGTKKFGNENACYLCVFCTGPESDDNLFPAGSENVPRHSLNQKVTALLAVCTQTIPTPSN